MIVELSVKRQRANALLLMALQDWDWAERSVANRNYALASLMETFWWLRIGALVGYLNSTDVNELFAQNSQRLLDGLREFRRSWAHTIDPDVLDGLETALSTKSLVGVRLDSDRLESPEKLLPTFQLASILAYDYSQLSGSRDLAIALNFLLADRWEALLAEEAPSEEILSAMEDERQGEISLSSVLAGFFAAVEHMQAFRDLLQNTERADEICRYDWVWIRSQIIRGQKWRLNWEHVESTTRFLRLAELAAQRLQIEAMRNFDSHVQFLTGEFLRSVQVNMDNWTRMRYREAGGP